MSTPESLPKLRNMPDLPLPWQPSQRLNATNNLWLDNPKENEAVKAYIRDIKQKYIITGIGVIATEIITGRPGFDRRLLVDKPLDEMQREFEQSVLGLEPSNSTDGLHYWESAAGATGGTYAIEPFAALVGAKTEHLQKILIDKNATRFGHVILKSHHYIVPVKKHQFDPTLVYGDQAFELNEMGEEYLKRGLQIAQYAQEATDRADI